MRDVTIYFRNNPSVLFYEGGNQFITFEHMSQIKLSEMSGIHMEVG